MTKTVCDVPTFPRMSSKEVRRAWCVLDMTRADLESKYGFLADPATYSPADLHQWKQAWYAYESAINSEPQP